MRDPLLSIVVLAWDQIEYTRACVESLRANTDVPYELIIVDNGSAPAAASYAESAADVTVLNDSNRGFAAGMNQGLERATGKYVAFVNNDTVFPASWASSALEHFASPNIGIVAPAVTAAGNPVTVRSAPGSQAIHLTPFGELPSGVVYILPTDLVRDIGGWNEAYPVASAEDLDLAFTIWTNDLSIVLDERVLIEHVSRGTVKTKLPDRRALYRSNLNRFLDRWQGDDEIVRLPTCDPARHARNRAAGRAAATWLRRLIEERDKSARLGARPEPQGDQPKKRRFRR